MTLLHAVPFAKATRKRVPRVTRSLGYARDDIPKCCALLQRLNASPLPAVIAHGPPFVIPREAVLMKPCLGRTPDLGIPAPVAYRKNEDFVRIQRA